MPNIAKPNVSKQPVKKVKIRPEPVWRGPEEDGITFSLLSRFLVCKERFRILVVDGLKPADGFNHRLEYGNMWHVCEEAWAGSHPQSWKNSLTDYCKKLGKDYPTQHEQILKWYNVCATQFPVYVRYWQQNHDVVNRTPLMQEQVFDVPYHLPSGRVVRLRGKWDSVDLIGKGKNASIYLQENKTKGEVDQQQMMRQLTFDLQTMMYLVALTEAQEMTNSGESDNPLPDECCTSPIAGVRYNVIRRPLSGGKGSIVQGSGTMGSKCGKCKGNGSMPSGGRCIKCGGEGRTGGKPPESDKDYYARLSSVIEENADTFFMRFKVEVTRHDIKLFSGQCLDPILDSLCDWWSWLQDTPDPWHNAGGMGTHWRHPFGVWNVLDEGGSSELDEYMATGSTAGLARTDNLFPELT